MKGNMNYTQAEGPLIKTTRGGSAEAFSELVRLHSRRIYFMSLSILKNHADAEDNLQDLLCNVLQIIGRSAPLEVILKTVPQPLKTEHSLGCHRKRLSRRSCHRLPGTGESLDHDRQYC